MAFLDYKDTDQGRKGNIGDITFSPKKGLSKRTERGWEPASEAEALQAIQQKEDIYDTQAVGVGERFLMKNLGTGDEEQTKRLLAKRYQIIDTDKGPVLIDRKTGAAGVIDKNGFDIQDLSDVATDVVQGALTSSAAVLGGPLGGAAAGLGTELAKQKAAQALGVQEDDLDVSNLALSTIFGSIPFEKVTSPVAEWVGNKIGKKAIEEGTEKFLKENANKGLDYIPEEVLDPKRRLSEGQMDVVYNDLADAIMKGTEHMKKLRDEVYEFGERRAKALGDKFGKEPGVPVDGEGNPTKFWQNITNPLKNLTPEERAEYYLYKEALETGRDKFLEPLLNPIKEEGEKLAQKIATRGAVGAGTVLRTPLFAQEFGDDDAVPKVLKGVNSLMSTVPDAGASPLNEALNSPAFFDKDGKLIINIPYKAE